MWRVKCAVATRSCAANRYFNRPTTIPALQAVIGRHYSSSVDPVVCLPCGGTVKEYRRHVVIETSAPPETWPPKIELLATVHQLMDTISM
jgi:predicted transcriptional regulator